MMERPDAIAVLEGMHHLNLKMLDFEEFRRCRTAAGQYRKKAEALQAAISALEDLEELDRNKAKARKTLTALRRCHDYPELCDGCPYRDATITACGEQLDYDIEELLAAAYEEGGENDEQS